MFINSPIGRLHDGHDAEEVALASAGYANADHALPELAQARERDPEPVLANFTQRFLLPVGKLRLAAICVAHPAVVITHGTYSHMELMELPVGEAWNTWTQASSPLTLR